MRSLIVLLCFLVSLGGCMIDAEGPRISRPPPAVQGSDDVQGAPLSVPGAGMGVGSGSVGSIKPAGMTNENSR